MVFHPKNVPKTIGATVSRYARGQCATRMRYAYALRRYALRVCAMLMRYAYALCLCATRMRYAYALRVCATRALVRDSSPPNYSLYLNQAGDQLASITRFRRSLG